MGRLLYFQPCSLDLRIADAAGDFSWAEPSEEVHAFANDLERAVGLHVYGRRMWETMRFWETVPEHEPGVTGEYGRIWRAAEKVVVSGSLTETGTARTTLLPRFDPRALRERVDASTGDAAIGGAALAGAALRAGVVDEVHLLLVPVVVGEGPRALPDDLRASLDLVGQRSFAGGRLSLRYAVRRPA